MSDMCTLAFDADKKSTIYFARHTLRHLAESFVKVAIRRFMPTHAHTNRHICINIHMHYCTHENQSVVQ